MNDFPRYEICFNHPEKPRTPRYRLAGTGEEWKDVPRRGGHGFFYDPIEDHPAYQAIAEQVDAAARAAIGGDRGFGSCHAFWPAKAELLRTQYGIRWHSPAILNRGVLFD